MVQEPWNSLEIAKLCVAGLTPILLVLLGIAVQRAIKQFEHQQWRSQKLIEKRIQIYDSLAPQLNLLFCYFTYVGPWRDVPPPEIVKAKREIDRQVYLAKPLFTPRFFNACMDFLDLCFQTYTGWGKDALLRTKCDHRRDALGENWNQDWEQCFSNEPTAPQAIRECYEWLMNTFSSELGVCEFATVKTDVTADHTLHGRIRFLWSILVECAS